MAPSFFFRENCAADVKIIRRRRLRRDDASASVPRRRCRHRCRWAGPINE